MAAKTFDSWAYETFEKLGTNAEAIARLAWNAATEAAVERFASTNLENAEALKPSHNTGSPKWPPCKTCGHPMFEHQWLYKSYNFCPECGRQLRASA